MEEIGYEVMGQIVSAFQYMHEKGFTHNDFKPENVSFNEATNKIKILDFGLSKKINSPQSNYGSPIYMAPEVHLSTNFTPQFSDVWSIGITFYEILTGDVPWSDCEDQDDLLDKLMFEDEKNLFKYPEYLSNETIFLLKKILKKDPLKRITIENLDLDLRKLKDGSLNQKNN